jgi:hypothetical protein
MAVTLALGLTVLLPDLAMAGPFAPAPGAQPNSALVWVGGIVCDMDGCRNYDTRYRRRIYREPPIYDDPYYDPPPVYVRPRVQRRIYVEPEPRVYPQRSYRAHRHMQWCLDRYRSYDPRTDLYLARRNVFRHCISPFS